MPRKKSPSLVPPPLPAGEPTATYAGFVAGLSGLLDRARAASARAVNGVITATYWEVGRRIVAFEQGGKARAGYGDELLKRLATDLTARHGRGFSKRNVEQMRAFYLAWPAGGGKAQTPSAELDPDSPIAAFPLPWSHYVRLLSVENPHARAFYEAEAVRGGWSVRQLDRQVGTRFYERAALSRNRAATLSKGQVPQPGDALTPAEAVRDPHLLEFLDLTDEYGEGDLEEALVRQLEAFLLELGGDFCFVGRQRKLRLDDAWYKVDLVFFHRRLRCLVLADLKLGKFTHADAGQMHLYLNYAREHWVNEGENPPVGLILCAEKGRDVARYALEGLGNTVLASTYRTALPAEEVLTAELQRTRRALELRASPNENPVG